MFSRFFGGAVASNAARYVNVLPQALDKPDWFSKAVSVKLQMPILAGGNDKKWPEQSRQALVAYGTSNWMIRALT